MQFLDDWLKMPSMALGDLSSLALACGIAAGTLSVLRALLTLIVTAAWSVFLRVLGAPPKVIQRFALEAGGRVLHFKSSPPR